jgi:hypothetical protein
MDRDERQVVVGKRTRRDIEEVEVRARSKPIRGAIPNYSGHFVAMGNRHDDILKILRAYRMEVRALSEAEYTRGNAKRARRLLASWRRAEKKVNDALQDFYEDQRKLYGA